MKNNALIVVMLAMCTGMAGCLERVDSDLPVAAAAASGMAVEWDLIGTFGGDAQVSKASDDPWDVRYAPGGFIEIAGVCAAGGEVWVCDLGISRVQVFDFDGNHLRSIGMGVPLKGTLATDEELFIEQDEFDKDTTVRWEDGEGTRWLDRRRDLFKAADVLPADDGYWMADWTRSSATNKPKRPSTVMFVPDEGDIEPMPSENFSWPSFLAYDGLRVAVSQPPMNSLMLLVPVDGKWKLKIIGSSGSYYNIMKVRVNQRDNPRYVELLARASAASIKESEFNGLGGVALAFDKLIACDAINHRLQVFDARRDEFEQHWCELLRVIPAFMPNGDLRFETPWDIDVGPSGQVFILDAGRREVALLTPEFKRVGRFANGELNEPYALDLSDDGRHCFITDQRNNVVLHYAARD